MSLHFHIKTLQWFLWVYFVFYFTGSLLPGGRVPLPYGAAVPIPAAETGQPWAHTAGAGCAHPIPLVLRISYRRTKTAF